MWTNVLKIRVVVADYASLAHVLLGNSIITLLIFDDCSDLAALIYDTQTHSKKKKNQIFTFYLPFLPNLMILIGRKRGVGGAGFSAYLIYMWTIPVSLISSEKSEKSLKITFLYMST